MVVNWYGKKGIKITPVTKGVCGSTQIAALFSQHDIHSIGDSHIQNIKKIRKAGIDAKFLLLRAPMLHETEDCISLTDLCLISELAVVKRLNECAAKYEIIYSIILMIELGDLREGILSSEVDHYVRRIKKFRNIRLAGIGSNLVCLNGIKPTSENMEQLSSIAKHIQEKFSCKLDIVSGGNSANYQWGKNVEDTGLINHLRIGESILLGSDPISQSKIQGLESNAFILEAEVIESKKKMSMPVGIPTFTAFGDIPVIKDEGKMNRAILAIGMQDLDIKGCEPLEDGISIIGATSDHLVVSSNNRLLTIGEIVRFNVTYRALLRLMVSPYVEKYYSK